MQCSLWGSDGRSSCRPLEGNNAFSGFVKNILELFLALCVLTTAAVVVCGLVYYRTLINQKKCLIKPQSMFRGGKWFLTETTSVVKGRLRGEKQKFNDTNQENWVTLWNAQSQPHHFKYYGQLKIKDEAGGGGCSYRKSPGKAQCIKVRFLCRLKSLPFPLIIS